MIQVSLTHQNGNLSPSPHKQPPGASCLPTSTWPAPIHGLFRLNSSYCCLTMPDSSKQVFTLHPACGPQYLPRVGLSWWFWNLISLMERVMNLHVDWLFLPGLEWRFPTLNIPEQKLEACLTIQINSHRLIMPTSKSPNYLLPENEMFIRMGVSQGWRCVPSKCSSFMPLYLSSNTIMYPQSCWNTEQFAVGILLLTV